MDLLGTFIDNHDNARFLRYPDPPFMYFYQTAIPLGRTPFLLLLLLTAWPLTLFFRRWPPRTLSGTTDYKLYQNAITYTLMAQGIPIIYVHIHFLLSHPPYVSFAIS
jgi:hypothetical protein